MTVFMKPHHPADFSMRFHEELGSPLNGSIRMFNHRFETFASRALEMRSSTLDTCDLCSSMSPNCENIVVTDVKRVQSELQLFSEYTSACSSHTATNIRLQPATSTVPTTVSTLSSTNSSTIRVLDPLASHPAPTDISSIFSTVSI